MTYYVDLDGRTVMASDCAMRHKRGIDQAIIGAAGLPKAIFQCALTSERGVQRLFRTIGVHTYGQACDHVWRLPYGRNALSSVHGGANDLPQAPWLAVLREGRGTCSTKHALLKALADELKLPVALYVGIYDMCEDNTPGVGSVLRAEGLQSMPEAHCYLRVDDVRYDFTRYGVTSCCPIDLFLYEAAITPADIGDRKTAIHQSYLAEHCPQRPLTEWWRIREACIAALGDVGVRGVRSERAPLTVSANRVEALCWEDAD